MPRRLSAMIPGGVVVVALAAAAAEAACVPVNGHAETVIVAPSQCTSPVGLCTDGHVIGGLQGALALTATSLVPSGAAGLPTVFFFTGVSEITARDGSQLIGIDTGSIDVLTGKVATLLTWTGGTGAFTDASGQIRVRADVQSDGRVVSDYLGELCTP